MQEAPRGVAEGLWVCSLERSDLLEPTQRRPVRRPGAGVRRRVRGLVVGGGDDAVVRLLVVSADGDGVEGHAIADSHVAEVDVGDGSDAVTLSHRTISATR